jgi:xanthine dehydrogenase large subunit
MIAIERVIDAVAARLAIDPLAVRQANLYGPGRDVTPYGMMLNDNIAPDLIARLRAEARYDARREAVAAFNACNTTLKKGIALTPVKFGISFTTTHLNQAGALVLVYTDGSIQINHGGTEMGQGLNTKVAQVVAHELGVGFDSVRVTATDTHKVVNTSATAASTGTDLNGKAAQDAARQIRERLAAFAAAQNGCDVSEIRFANDRVHVGGHHDLSFCELVTQAYLARVQLWSDGFYATPGLHWNRETLQGKKAPSSRAWAGSRPKSLCGTRRPAC